MKTTKMSLANIEGKLSRAEMKQIMAGSGTMCFARICQVNTDCCTDHPVCKAGATAKFCESSG